MNTNFFLFLVSLDGLVDWKLFKVFLLDEFGLFVVQPNWPNKKQHNSIKEPTSWFNLFSLHKFFQPLSI